MIICFTTDLHGRVNLYEQADELARRSGADVLILGGDMLPDGEMSNPGPAQTGFVRGWFAEWVRRLSRKLPGCRVATIFGNHDWLCALEAMDRLDAEGLLTVLRPDRPAEFGGWKVLGFSLSPPSPFFTKDLERLDRPGDSPPVAGGGRWDPATQSVVPALAPDHFTSGPTIQEELANVIPVNGQWILVSHAPPFDSGLDLLITGESVGSRAVREFIEQRRPAISLHGHLHDSPYRSGRFYEQIGETISINPGQGAARLAAVTFDPDDVIGTIQGHGIRLPSSD